MQITFEITSLVRFSFYTAHAINFGLQCNVGNGKNHHIINKKKKIKAKKYIKAAKHLLYKYDIVGSASNMFRTK